MLSNRATEVSYSRLAQLGLLTYSLTSQKVRKLHFNKAQTREKKTLIRDFRTYLVKHGQFGGVFPQIFRYSCLFA